MKIIEKKTSELIPYANNPRKNEKAVDIVASSIKNYGFKVPIVIDQKNEIVTGHTRLKAAEKLGMEKVPCIIADDLTPSQIKAFRLVDNKTAEYSDWDIEKLNIELEDLPELEDFGFEMPEIDLGYDEEKEDEMPENIETICKVGDMWQLGNHRLICGDCTDEMIVKKLMKDDIGDLIVTDPPYNVNYQGSGVAKKPKILNDNKTNEEFLDFLSNAFINYSNFIKLGGAFYIFNSIIEFLNFTLALQKSGLEFKQELIWNKNRLIVGMSDYQSKHEPILYGWKPGASHFWNSDRKQTTVIDFDRPIKNSEHPTMKPVGLIEYLIRNSSKKGEIVLDFFGGSGTTLIASEKIGRKCRMAELDEHYCDVIIARWEEYTGKKARKIDEI